MKVRRLMVSWIHRQYAAGETDKRWHAETVVQPLHRCNGCTSACSVNRQSDGRYRAFDAHSQEIGDFVELADATAAVRDVSDDLIADNVDGVAR